MVDKCIGIVSYLPDKEPLRSNRKKKLNKMMGTFNTYFKLPIIIIAQNGKEDDYNLNYDYPIKIYSYKQGLGITKARIILREKLLQEDYNYFIFSDDDLDLVCTQEKIDEYMKQLDNHPNMFGLFLGGPGPRLLAISKYMLNLMNYDYIKDLEASRGEVWEDVAYIYTYKKIYPDKGYSINIKGLKENRLPSEYDKDTTGYKPEFDNIKRMKEQTDKIIKEGVKELS